MLVVWRVEYQFLLFDFDQSEENWRSAFVYHLGSENGSKAANYVQDQLLGSDVTITVRSPLTVISPPQPDEEINTKIVSWRLTGLKEVCRIDIIEKQHLIDSGVLSSLQSLSGQGNIIEAA